MNRISPTGSYTVLLPSDVREDHDDGVNSYWREGSDVLLQFSSYLRVQGDQVGADERLSQGLGREGLSDITPIYLSPSGCPDSAAARGCDAEGLGWVYCYAVWPRLSLLATITGKAAALDCEGDWAFDAVRSIERCI